MSKREPDALAVFLASLKEKGETDESILETYLRAYHDHKCTLAELEAVCERLGVELSPKFYKTALNPEDHPLSEREAESQLRTMEKKKKASRLELVRTIHSMEQTHLITEKIAENLYESFQFLPLNGIIFDATEPAVQEAMKAVDDTKEKKLSKEEAKQFGFEHLKTAKDPQTYALIYFTTWGFEVKEKVKTMTSSALKKASLKDILG
ncbi:MAG: hypothetical protein LKM30_02820 [Bacilli bacterium]|nr:hypothetical protein [Bacilli bacterium]